MDGQAGVIEHGLGAVAHHQITGTGYGGSGVFSHDGSGDKNSSRAQAPLRRIFILRVEAEEESEELLWVFMS